MPLVGRTIGPFDQVPVISPHFLKPKYRREPASMLVPFEAAVDRIAKSVAVLADPEILPQSEAAEKVLGGRRFNDLLERSQGPLALLDWTTSELFHKGKAHLKVLYEEDSSHIPGSTNSSVLSDVDFIDQRHIVHLGRRTYHFLRPWWVDRGAVIRFSPDLAPLVGKLCPVDGQHLVRFDLNEILSRTRIKPSNVKQARKLGARSSSAKSRVMNLWLKSFTNDIANLRRHLALTRKPLSKYEVDEIAICLMLGTLRPNEFYSRVTKYYYVWACLHERLNVIHIWSAILAKLAEGLSRSASAVTGEECRFTFKGFDQDRLHKLENFPIDEILYKGIDTWENLEKRANLAVSAIDLLGRN